MGKDVWIGYTSQLCGLEVNLKLCQNFFRIIHKIEHKSFVLAFVGTV